MSAEILQYVLQETQKETDLDRSPTFLIFEETGAFQGNLVVWQEYLLAYTSDEDSHDDKGIDAS